MNRSDKSRWGSRWRSLCITLLVVACGGAVGQSTAGGESHFLRHCAESCGEGLECVTGVCTRGCLVGQDSCTDLSPDATCTDQSFEPGAIAVCDVSCSVASDCDKLGNTYDCEDGFCRGPALSNEPPGSNPSGNAGQGGGAGTGTAANGGSAGSGGAPVACIVWSTVRVAAENCAPDGVCVDDPTDACDPDVEPDCPGTCRSTEPTLPCGGSVANAHCPPGLTCLAETAFGTNPVSFCQGPESVFDCAPLELACGEGFSCIRSEDNRYCVPQGVNCHMPYTCELPLSPQYRDDCPFGYHRSAPARPGECEGPCVPVHTCGCTTDEECPENTACNYWTGRCAPLPWKPPALCSLPLDEGTCDANTPRFGMQDGKCIEWTYGGCGGNANNFRHLEECLSVCEGSPHHNPCPAGRFSRPVCLDCGPADECTTFIDGCVLPCDEETDCEGFLSCSSEGFCEALCP
jgi:hypothetical protein